MKKVLITGGTSGIGLALLRLFIADGYNCIVVAKQDDMFFSTEKEFEHLRALNKIVFYPLDLSNADAADNLYHFLTTNNCFPTVLINNAGFGTHGEIINNDIQTESQMIRLHVNNLYLITRICLNEFIKKGEGHIINISSIAAFQPSPLLGTYGATKAFVYHFSRALSFELTKLKLPIFCLTVCPTPVKTNFGKGTSMVDTDLFTGWMVQTPENVAKAIYKAFKKKDSFIVPGRAYHILAKITRRLPIQWQMALSYQFSKKNQ